MAPIYGQALITIPSVDRIGIVPTLQVLFVSITVIMLSFQNYLTDFDLLMSYDLVLPQDVCDILIMLSFPATLMFMFVVSNIRIRLNMHAINAWSIIHTILIIINLTQIVLYILARPEGCFAFMTDLTTESTSGTVQKIVDFIKKFANDNESFIKRYTVDGTIGYRVAMFFASYSFIVEALFVVIFVTMSCSLYGELQALVTMKQDNGTYFIDLKYSKPKIGNIFKKHAKNQLAASTAK